MDDALTLRAQVVDQFSGPLKKLRDEILGTGKAGAVHTDALAKGFNRVEGAMQSAGKTASAVVNPALGTLGVTSLSAAAAVGGIAYALTKLTGNLSALGQLNRQTGIASSTLQEFGAVAGRFGIEQDAVAAGARTFAGNMREFGRSTGEAFRFIMRQGTDAAGRKAFQDFAKDIQGTADEGEKLKKALSFMETIKNPVERGIFARQLFGNEDFGQIADGHLGKVVDLFKKAREKIGTLDPNAILNAEKFDKAVSDLTSSMQRVGTAIATELLGPATKFTTWLDDLASGKRKEFLDSIRGGLRDIRAELEKIDWHAAGETAKEALVGTTALVGTLAKALKEVAAAVKSLNEGNYADALGRLDGADGPLRRRLAPRVGDDEKAAEQEVFSWKKALAEAEYDQETGGPALDFKSREPYLRQKLQESENELRRLQARSPAERQKDFDAADRNRKALDANTEELKNLRSGATVQPQSFSGGTGLGGLIHTAGYGGAYRRLGGGVQAAPGVGSQMGSVPRGGGGGGGYGGAGGGAGPLVPPDSETGRKVEALRGGGRGAAQTGQMMAYAMDELRRQGVPEDQLRQAAAHLVGQAHMESGLDPNKVHDGGTGYGIYGARDPGGPGKQRRSEMLKWMRANGYAPNSAEGQMRYMAYEAMTDPSYRATRRVLMGQGTGDVETDTNTITRNFEAPKVINRRSGAVRNAMRVGPTAADAAPSGGPLILKPKSMPDAPGVTMEEADRARERPSFNEELKEVRAQQDARAAKLRQSGRLLDATVAGMGGVGGQRVDAHGRVDIHIGKPGPQTTVSSSASGNLFRDIVHQDGRQMRKAN